MTRQNSLLRLRKALWARKVDLCKALADEMKNLHDLRAADATGDSADAAFEADSDEVSSQLAQMDSRELSQIERALSSLKRGKYGTCENCKRKIALTRLNALPYATLCINCEREIEKYPGWPGRSGTGQWGQIIDWDAPTGDHRIKLSRRVLASNSL